MDFNREIQLLIDDTLSPEAQSREIATFARQTKTEIMLRNAAIIGRDIAVQIIVDGVLNAIEDAVKPDGRIEYEFDVTDDAILFAMNRLRELSPVRSGLYRSAHTLYADGVEIPEGHHVPTDAMEYVILNPLPYALRIEQGESPQAENGVYELVEWELNQEYGDQVESEYNLRSTINAEKYISVAYGKHARASNDERVPSLLIRRRIKQTVH
jgi:hypothetical protein